jgi:hypothetical protein
MIKINVRPLGSGLVSISAVDVTVKRTEHGTTTTVKHLRQQNLRADSIELVFKLATYRRCADAGNIILTEEAI